MSQTLPRMESKHAHSENGQDSPNIQQRYRDSTSTSRQYLSNIGAEAENKEIFGPKISHVHPDDFIAKASSYESSHGQSTLRQQNPKHIHCTHIGGTNLDLLRERNYAVALAMADDDGSIGDDWGGSSFSSSTQMQNHCERPPISDLEQQRSYALAVAMTEGEGTISEDALRLQLQRNANKQEGFFVEAPSPPARRISEAAAITTTTSAAASTFAPLQPCTSQFVRRILPESLARNETLKVGINPRVAQGTRNGKNNQNSVNSISDLQGPHVLNSQLTRRTFPQHGAFAVQPPSLTTNIDNSDSSHISQPEGSMTCENTTLAPPYNEIQQEADYESAATREQRNQEPTVDGWPRNGTMAHRPTRVFWFCIATTSFLVIAALISGSLLLTSRTASVDNIHAATNDPVQSPSYPIAFVPFDICGAKVPGDGSSKLCSTKQTSTREGGVCNLVVQSFLDQTVGVNMALHNAATCSSDIPRGMFYRDNATTLFPHSYSLTVVRMSGAEILQILEGALAAVFDNNENDAYPYTAALRFRVNTTAPIGQRLSNVQVDLEGVWIALDLSYTYTVVTNNVLAQGGTGYEGFKRLPTDRFISTGQDATEVLVDYITTQTILLNPRPGDFSTQALLV